MNVKEITDKFGFPARIRIPLVTEGADTFGQKFRHVEYIHRTITKRLENGHFLQYDETQPWLGEFLTHYEEGTPHNDWEYTGKPTKEQLPKLENQPE